MNKEMLAYYVGCLERLEGWYKQRLGMLPVEVVGAIEKEIKYFQKEIDKEKEK